MGPGKKTILVEEVLAVPTVVAVALVVEAVAVVAKGFKNSRKGLQFVAEESEGEVVRTAEGCFETVIPAALEGP